MQTFTGDNIHTELPAYSDHKNPTTSTFTIFLSDFGLDHGLPVMTCYFVPTNQYFAARRVDHRRRPGLEQYRRHRSIPGR